MASLKLDKIDELRYLSKVMMHPNVEEFDWRFEDKNLLKPEMRPKMRELFDVEAILIHAKWADHGFDPLTQTVKPHKAGRQKAFSGINIEDFKKLRIPDSVMKDGILFIWAEKELIYEIVIHFEKQGFAYIENVTYCTLDKKEQRSTVLRNNTDATPAIARKKYDFLNKSHKTLLMLRRTKYDTCTTKKPSEDSYLSYAPPKQMNRLELRH